MVIEVHGFRQSSEVLLGEKENEPALHGDKKVT